MRKLGLFGPWLIMAFAGAQSSLGATARDADSAYVLNVEAPPAQRGHQAKAKIRITPTAGYHMNKEYPAEIALVPPSGVTLAKAKLTAKDAARLDAQTAEFDVGYTAAQPGKKTVTGEVKFAVCSARSCDPKKAKLTFDLEIR
jgi:hypothetical protein